MSAPANSTPAAEMPVTLPDSPARDSASAIDASCRWPLLLLFACGVAWLMISSVLGLLGSIKMHAPGFLAEYAWLTVGRVRPAAMNALIYGFATQVSLGVVLWMMARLGGRKLLYPGAVFVAGLFWNLGVKYGTAGILFSGPSGFEWLQMPRFASPLLFIAFLLLAISALLNFTYRRERSVYVSQWYLVAALFWFAWVFAVGSYLLLFDPVRGVLQAAVNAWFASNLLGLWLTPVGLAIVFYFVPKLTDKPLHNYWLAVFGFWTLAAFGGWTGLTQFVGGPLPRWMVSASVVANGLMILPVLAVAMNWHGTLQGAYGRWKTDFVLRFVLAGAACYLASALMTVLFGFESVNRMVMLTLVPLAKNQLALQGFVALTLFGSLYYILPRLMQVEWPSTRLIHVHFLATVAGLVFMVVPLTVGGLIQGFRLNDPNADMVAMARTMSPFLGNATLGLLFLLAGQIAFAANACRMLWRYCQTSSPVTEMLNAVETANSGGQP